jgi:hypothetical protein
MRDIYGAIILAIFIYCFLFNFENFYSRPNKCFDCEKQVKPEDIHLAFPSKCFDCEKQAIANKQPAYNTGPTKCFDCEDLPEIHGKFAEANNEFLMLNRNLMVKR